MHSYLDPSSTGRRYISIVIPAYREESNISPFWRELRAVITPLERDYDFEVIFIDDGSTDGTWREIARIARDDPRVRGIRFSKNFGKEIALTAGIEQAKGHAIITIDADGQHPPERIRDFIDQWRDGYDIVYNKRPHTQGISIFKGLTSRIFYALVNLVSTCRIEPASTDYRLIDRRVAEAFLRLHEKNRIYRGLIDLLGFESTVLIFDAKERRDGGQSVYGPMKLLKLAIDSITSFSMLPLKLVGILGLLITFGGISILGVIILDRFGFFHFGFSNLAIIVVINTILTGIMLMSLGLIALYIANIHDEVRGRPLYIVRETIGGMQDE